MCHYSHCRLWQSGTETEGRGELQKQKGGWDGCGFHRQMVELMVSKRREKRFSRQLIGWDGFELVNCLKMSQTFDSGLLNFMECSLFLVLPHVALRGVGGPCSDIHNGYNSISYREGLLCKPQASSSVLHLVFSHVEEKTGDDFAAFRLAFIEQTYS